MVCSSSLVLAVNCSFYITSICLDLTLILFFPCVTSQLPLHLFSRYFSEQFIHLSASLLPTETCCYSLSSSVQVCPQCLLASKLPYTNNALNFVNEKCFLYLGTYGQNVSRDVFFILLLKKCKEIQRSKCCLECQRMAM